MDELSIGLIREVKNYFQDRVSDFCSSSGHGFPPGINIEFILYKYLLVEILIERNTAFIGIREGKKLISLLSTELLKSDKCYLRKGVIGELDQEIRLRIPDKYLTAKGWA